MWVLIIIGAIAFIAIAFYTDKKQVERKTEDKGGMQVRFKELVDLLLSKPKSSLTRLTADHVTVTWTENSYIIKCSIIESFGNTIVDVNCVGETSFKQGFKFKEDFKQEFMYGAITEYVDENCYPDNDIPQVKESLGQEDSKADYIMKAGGDIKL